jgi:hypothetical protein
MADRPTDQELIAAFVHPDDDLDIERAALVAKIYAGVLAGGQGYQDDRAAFAQKSVAAFLRMIGEDDSGGLE